MNTFPRAIFQDAAYRLDLVNDDIVTDYSGRGMYGEECFGLIISDISTVLQLFTALAVVTSYDDSRDEATDINGLAKAAHTDAYGEDTILYFPGWKLAD